MIRRSRQSDAQTQSQRSDIDETTDNPYPPDLDGLPGSCEVIWHVLEKADEPLTQKEICERTARPPRTVRQALTRLRDDTDLLDERPTRDARQSIYVLRS